MMLHHETPVLVPHWEGYEYGRDDTHAYVGIWQGFNTRLIAVPHGPDGEWGYDFAWCFPRDLDAIRAAVAAWDPDTQDEPDGWHKRPTREVRQAPRREEAAEHNRPRCVHGCYVEEECRTVNCPDVIRYAEAVAAGREYTP